MADDVLSKPRLDLYGEITKRIAAAIQAGPCEFKAPWHIPAGHAALPTNALTHADYRGINILNLWIEAQLRGYANNLWASYRQWKELGAQVRRGERGSLVVFYKRTETSPTEPEDPDRSRKLKVFAKASWVFNVSQVDNFQPVTPPSVTPIEGCNEVEAFVEALCPIIQHGFVRACYRRDTDTIEMPERGWFLPETGRPPQEAYYAVLLHELTHWSGAPHRLNRRFGQRFGDDAYAMEELVAELGAAFLCAAVGLSTEPRPDHAAYVASWLKVLGRDPKALFFAASRAQEAAEFMTYLATGIIPRE